MYPLWWCDALPHIRAILQHLPAQPCSASGKTLILSGDERAPPRRRGAAGRVTVRFANGNPERSLPPWWTRLIEELLEPLELRVEAAPHQRQSLLGEMGAQNILGKGCQRGGVPGTGAMPAFGLKARTGDRAHTYGIGCARAG